MSLSCPECGANLSLNLTLTDTLNGATTGPQASASAYQAGPNDPNLTPTGPQVEQGSVQVGEVRSSPKKRYSYPDENFQAFWKVYPRRVGKASAFAKWRLAVREVDPQLIIRAARAYERRTRHIEMEFHPYPEKWLAHGRWDDEDVSIGADNTPQATDWDAYRAEEDARIAALLKEEVET